MAADAGVPAVSTPTALVVAFAELDARTAYDVWRLRQDVFVVEQECPYPDLDGRDTEPGTRHVLLQDGDGALVGCARVLDDGDVWRIGRVLLAPGRPRPRPGRPPGAGLPRRPWPPARSATSCSTRSPRWPGWYAGVRLRGQRAGVPRGRHRAPADAAGPP